MLSKIDIIEEFSKNINIYPFKKENLKENSINLSASSCAWNTSHGDIFIDKNGEVRAYDSSKSQNSKQCNLDKIKRVGKIIFILLIFYGVFYLSDFFFKHTINTLVHSSWFIWSYAFFIVNIN